MLSAFNGQLQGHFITFPSPEALWQTFTPKRWEIIREMVGSGSMAIRELGHRMGRDVQADVQVLLTRGVLDKTTDGKIKFPYDEVHVDFIMAKVA